MRRRAVPVLAVTAGLAGCFSTPRAPLDHDGATGDGPPSGSGSLVASEAPLTIETSGFRLAFRDDSWKFPESLVWLGRPQEELFSFDAPFGEYALGLTLYDTYAVNAGAPYTGNAIRELVAAGPARAAAQITWTGLEQCSGGGAIANNKSKFSFYPDGRIVRHDEINTGGACDKTLGVVSSFVWRSDTIGSYNVEGNSGSLQGPPTTESYPSWSRPTVGRLCLENTVGTIAMTFTPPEVATDWDKVEVHLQPTTFGLGYYFSEGAPQQAMHTYMGDTTLIVRAGATCADLLPQLAAAQTPPTMTNATYLRDIGAYSILSGVSVAQGELPAGYVLQYETPSPSVTIMRTGLQSSRSKTLESGVDYIEQHEGHIFTLFMLDALHNGESLTIPL